MMGDHPSGDAEDDGMGTQTPSAESDATSVGAQMSDIVVVGAGISGLNALQRLQEFPGAKIAVLEAREVLGGTWSYWKYPGVRTDSMATVHGFKWHPWTQANKLPLAADFQRYIEEAADAKGFRTYIKFSHKVTGAAWDSLEQLWTLTVQVGLARTANIKWKTKFILWSSGYYSYQKALDPEPAIPGLSHFPGAVAHPQFWPDHLDITGKNIVIIGSGPTAMTMLPAVAEKARHTTMLQRSQNFAFPLPSEHWVDWFLRKIFLPGWLIHIICHWSDVLIELIFGQSLVRFPRFAREAIKFKAQYYLPEGFPYDEHFNPQYNPLGRRISMTPDGSFFKALSRHNCDIVTDSIKTITADGTIITQSNKVLQADIIVTATGMFIELMGGVTPTIDGIPIILSERYFWRGCMIEGMPNAILCLGYTINTWTLGSDIATGWMLRLLHRLNHAHQHSKDCKLVEFSGSVTPKVTLREKDGTLTPRNCLPRFAPVWSSARCWRASYENGRMPHSMVRVNSTNRCVWRGKGDWFLDYWDYLWGKLDDGLAFEEGTARIERRCCCDNK